LLAIVDAQLVAVLVRLDSSIHGERRGGVFRGGGLRSMQGAGTAGIRSASRSPGLDRSTREPKCLM
jgi:hypothetical protein